MTYILTNSHGQRPKGFTNSLFKKFDFSHDDKYTIGELKNFLIDCEEILIDLDLRFFYDNYFLIDGRVSINKIKISMFDKEINQKINIIDNLISNSLIVQGLI